MNIIFNTQDTFMALLGGALIGLSATLLLLFTGRIAGISGILNGVFTLNMNEKKWRIIFLMGLISGGLLTLIFAPQQFKNLYTPSLMQTILAGFIVGVGTKIGSGCTSGHGVCGISRLSLRSLIATLVFISSGILTVFLLGLG